MTFSVVRRSAEDPPTNFSRESHVPPTSKCCCGHTPLKVFAKSCCGPHAVNNFFYRFLWFSRNVPVRQAQLRISCLRKSIDFADVSETQGKPMISHVFGVTFWLRWSSLSLVSASRVRFEMLSCERRRPFGKFWSATSGHLELKILIRLLDT